MFDITNVRINLISTTAYSLIIRLFADASAIVHLPPDVYSGLLTDAENARRNFRASVLEKNGDGIKPYGKW